MGLYAPGGTARYPSSVLMTADATGASRAAEAHGVGAQAGQPLAAVGQALQRELARVEGDLEALEVEAVTDGAAVVIGTIDEEGMARTADRKFEDDNTVDRVGVDGLLSELDEYAVEQALQFREKREGEEITVTALTVGPEKAVDAVRKALQMGADKGILVSDEATLPESHRSPVSRVSSASPASNRTTSRTGASRHLAIRQLHSPHPGRHHAAGGGARARASMRSDRSSPSTRRAPCANFPRSSSAMAGG